jgi:hypothetical protein
MGKAADNGDDTFWGHVTAGIFLTAFGSFFLLLTLWRLHHGTASSSHKQRNLLQVFMEQHVPEQQPSRVVKYTSIVLILSTIFGLLYTGLGARFLHHDLHPDYTIFHYVAHLTLILLYMFAGWTGLLEAWSILPRDSLRSSVVFALIGESLLWYDHALSKDNDQDARIHAYLALISALTAICMLWSIIWTRGDAGVIMPFCLYIGGFLGLLWQGLWFFVAAIHQTWPISSTEHVTVSFVLLTIVLGCFTNVSVACLVHKQRGQNFDGHNQQEYSGFVSNDYSNDSECNEEDDKAVELVESDVGRVMQLV